MEHLLLRDEERRAMANKKRKQKSTHELVGSARNAKLDQMRAKVDRCQSFQPESLRAMKDLNDNAPPNDSRSEGDSNRNDGRSAGVSTRAALEKKQREFIAEIDSEVRELRSKFNRMKSMVHLVYTGGMFFLLGSMAFAAYTNLYEFPKPEPEPEVYFGIWNLWGFLSIFF